METYNVSMETIYLVRKDYESLGPSWYAYNTVEEMLKAFGGEIISGDKRVTIFRCDPEGRVELYVKTSVEVKEK